MRILHSLVVIVSLTLLCGLAGMGLGYGLGSRAPSYYRGVFARAAERPNFDPVQVGVGLGLTQGIVVGLILSVVVLALAALRSYRFRLKVQVEDLEAHVSELRERLARLERPARSTAGGEPETGFFPS